MCEDDSNSDSFAGIDEDEVWTCFTPIVSNSNKQKLTQKARRISLERIARTFMAFNDKH